MAAASSLGGPSRLKEGPHRPGEPIVEAELPRPQPDGEPTVTGRPERFANLEFGFTEPALFDRDLLAGFNIYPQELATRKLSWRA